MALLQQFGESMSYGEAKHAITQLATAYPNGLPAKFTTTEFVGELLGLRDRSHVGSA